MTGLELGLDVINLREQVYGLIQFTDATSILDIGCGTGYDLSRFGEFCGPNGTIIGIDTSHLFIRKAKQKSGNDSRLRFIQQNRMDV